MVNWRKQPGNMSTWLESYIHKRGLQRKVYSWHFMPYRKWKKIQYCKISSPNHQYVVVWFFIITTNFVGVFLLQWPAIWKIFDFKGVILPILKKRKTSLPRNSFYELITDEDLDKKSSILFCKNFDFKQKNLLHNQNYRTQIFQKCARNKTNISIK